MADPITAAIVSSIIGSVIEGALAPTPPEPVMGIVRMLPEEARIGNMLPPAQWQVQIDGKTYPLSHGAQIRNELNMMILPTMVEQPAKVRYLLDYSGAVYRIWILSSAEARLSEQR
ncbi:MAG: hypothetical protein Q8M20_14395 [Rhodocyclaceae bacterium]|nr:hypothetical protein [Rhodocyclaceae bacterium]MDZ4216190.1 hypothetical protein [Rhodocyclaceae bacterium]